jgi:Xaa-Pro dipeptidase
MNEARFARVIEKMKEHGLDQLIVSSTSSIFYLTGQWIDPGERMLALYLRRDGFRRLFVNELFGVEEGIGIDLSVFNDRETPVAILAEIVKPDKPLGIEKTWPSHFLIELMSLHPGMKVVNGSSAVDETRMVKDASEIELTRKASTINDQAMSDIIRLIPENHSEKELGRLLSDVYEKHGTEGGPFFGSIAYGAHAAEPHHGPDGTRLHQGDCVVLDIGCRIGQYWSDMTRTVFFGEPAEEHRKVFGVVYEANRRAIEKIKPGVRFCDVDRAARSVIEKAGYGRFFTHRTGHNIGIDIHEFPDVGAVNEMPLQPGMIFSIEPGIYLPGKCGVRLEDLVLVTETGGEVLNRYSKEVQVL